MPESSQILHNLFQRLGERGKRLLLATGVYLVFLLIAVFSVSPEQYDLKTGDVAPATITASRDIVDEITTERRRASAQNTVSSVYYKDETVADQVLSDMEACFTELRAVRELGAQIRSGWTDEDSSFSEQDYQQAAAMITMLSMNNYQLRTLMNTSQNDFENLYQSLLSATRTILVSNINEGQINDAVSNIQQIVAYNTRTDLWYNVGIPLLRRCLKPNMLIDQEATEANRQRAADAVDPVLYKVGQNVVVKGDRVTAEQIAVLESLGYIRGNHPQILLYISTSLLLASIFAGVWIVCLIMGQSQAICEGKTSMVMFFSALATVIAGLIVERLGSIRMLPVLLGAMLTVNLLDKHIAYLTNLFITLFLSFLAFGSTNTETVDMFAILLMGVVGGTFSILLLKKHPTRTFVLITGLICGAVNSAVMGCLYAMTSADSPRMILLQSGDAFIGALISAILCLGIQPIMESVFNLITPAKLIELSSPDQPLLRRLMIETPGTYHHSMVVANLAETAADEVGANALLVRVGAYYHDIGKLIRPQFFKENQSGENPHDKTEPQVSAAILTEHPRDGAELARKHHLPKQIIDLIEQHHGSTAVMYFYAKAVERFGAENVDIADYRYEGPKPQTAEAAILMLADTVEAAVRSMQSPDKEKMHNLIRKLVRGKMEDGQLDECTLTFRDIDKICGAFETALQGVFHERIEYPEMSAKKKSGALQRAKQKRAERK